MSDAKARSAMEVPRDFAPWHASDCRQPIGRRFLDCVKRWPGAVAVRLEDRDVSFAELDADVRGAAAVLLESPLGPRAPLAMLLEQGYHAVVWILAALRCARPYAPLDQRMPAASLRASIETLRPGAIVVPAHLREHCAGTEFADVPVIACERYTEGVDTGVVVEPGASFEDIAYVFCTSGSTGQPKAVFDSHRNVMHNVLRYTNTLRIAHGDVHSLVQNPSFSGTVSSLFAALLNGAAIAPFDLSGGGLSRLSSWLKRSGITIFHSVPSIFRQLADPLARFPSVRLIRLEGDRASRRDIEHYLQNFGDRCTLVNALGATETGLSRQLFIDRNGAPLAPDPVPVGFAAPDVLARIVDDEGREVAPGVVGEIEIESPYLASGYWRDPVKTHERFREVRPGVRSFRSGDLGRMDEDGCLTHLGRVDHRIRVGGRFVDTGEIEGLLGSVVGVRQALVRDYVDGVGNRRLCAYVVAADDVTIDRLHDAFWMGSTMRPTAFVFLDAFPLTTDGKIDTRRLPAPTRERPRLHAPYVVPGTEMERRIAEEWCQVLEVYPIGIDDPFLELGGDSLHAAILANRLGERLGGSFDSTTVFKHPTIRALATAVGERGTATIDVSQIG